MLGPRPDVEQIQKFLDGIGAKYTFYPDEDELCQVVARLIGSDKVIGWVQGRMEFGPRALGLRSILGDARSPAMQSVMNVKIKFREVFPPVCTRRIAGAGRGLF